MDPNRDCKIRRANGTLIIEMPGADHDYDPVRDRLNAPRILRDIEGDLEIQVRVRIDTRPSTQSTVKGQPSSVSAGFLLMYPEKGRSICCRMEYSVLQQGIGLDSYSEAPMLAGPRRERASRKGVGEHGCAVLKDWFCKKRNSNMTWEREQLKQFQVIWDRGWQEWPLAAKADYAYLRLELQGSGDYHFFMSPDGEKWTRLVAQSGPPAKLKLGLAAYSTSSEPSKVQFDRLKITRGNKKKR